MRGAAVSDNYLKEVQVKGCQSSPVELWPRWSGSSMAIMVMLISLTAGITVELQDIPSCCHGYAHILDQQHHCKVARYVPSLGLEVQPMCDTNKKKQHNSMTVNPLLELGVNWSTPTMLSIRKNSLCFSNWSSFRLEIRSSEVHNLHGYAWLLAMAVMVMLTSFTSGCIITAHNSTKHNVFAQRELLVHKHSTPFLARNMDSHRSSFCAQNAEAPLAIPETKTYQDLEM
jgi:hypothetical protein